MASKAPEMDQADAAAITRIVNVVTKITGGSRDAAITKAIALYYGDDPKIAYIANCIECGAATTRQLTSAVTSALNS